MKLTVVLPDGEIIETGCKARKSSSGYDLVRLFVGSEGTLGVVTCATLRLTGIPAHHLAVTITFNALEQASQAVAMLIGGGTEPAALELLTPELIELMNQHSHLGLAEVPSLFAEFHGISQESLTTTADLVRQLCEECGATDFRFGIEAEQRKELWRARHEAWETIHRAHPGNQTLIVDAAVPISKYPQMVLFAQQLLRQRQAVGYVFGHAGDGNLHVVLVGQPDIPEQWSALEEINDQIVTRAIELEGTCTGEHGIGIGKRKFMAREHGRSYALMHKIKRLLDPKGLMNPDKIF